MPFLAFKPARFSDPAAERLAAAGEKGDVRTIDELIQGRVNPNVRGLHNITPLLVTFGARNKRGFDALLRHGADPNLFDDNGRAVMLDAAGDEDPYWLENSLKHGGKPNLLSPETRRVSKGQVPIFYAVANHRGRNLKLLIDAGADMNHMDNGGMTAWRLAVGIPAYDMLFAMVEAGADFNKKDAIGQCLLDLISSRSEFYVVGDEQKLWFRKTVELLRAKGAEFTLRGEGK